MEKLSAKMKKTSLMPRWWKKRFTAVITESDPSFKVVYLGNVLTGWAKGEGCLDKPLATLWKNYCQSSRPDVSMRLSVCSSGLQATTSEHGLTEYWSHRVTWCSAPPSYPRIFAWVYRHEGRRLKQELRCHAVLCTTGRQARQLTARLEQRLREALHDFRREKLCRQSARLSVAACLYEDYASAIPKRKLLLAPGINNYKPPVERCKSAPKLGSIEESPELEEVEEKDWLRVLALRGAAQTLQRNNTVIKPVSPVRSSLETVREEDRCISTPALPCKIIAECDPSSDAVSPDGLLDLAEVKVTLMPDGGTSCVDGSPAAVQSECPMVKPMRLPLLRRMSAEARKKFGSADCVIDNSGRPSSPPPILPRRARRSPLSSSCNRIALSSAGKVNQEYVGVARRPTSEYIESRDEYLYDEEEIDFRLRLDSAVEELLESDSFSGSSPCSSADHSPNLADKGRLNLVPSPCDQVQAFHMLASEDHDNVSDESGYSDDKDVISSSSSVSDAGTVKTAKGAYTMAEEFTLNL
ncbi:uncharacterized protein LOC116923703 [Daphnia magna]|uniref:uncharacterized protein LOC116923703 n=1 Tax=Daphnia magna TaxID=35525 RepID=UPI001E1BB322|nr:uncharacterized protein LOC116923703 [Daphnia magna]